MNKDMTYSIASARSHFTDVVGQVAYGKERILITRHNQPLAYVVSVEDGELLEALENAYDVEAAKTALKEAEEVGFVEWDVLKKELKV